MHKGPKKKEEKENMFYFWPLNLFAESAKYNAYWDQVQRRNI